jgi:uncharacterized protein involved in outer membrane biogenesis
MTGGKKVLAAVAVLILLFAAAIAYVLTNLDFIVKRAIEKYGSQTTKTDVRVSAVSIRLTSGEASVTGLSVANPRGFSTPDIFSLGNISTKIAVKSVRKSPIVINEIRITAPKVFYEKPSSGSSNVDVLKNNLQKQEPQKGPVEKKGKKDEVKLFIRRLVIEKGRVETRIAALGGGPVTVDLPRLELVDIGKNGGATPDEVAKTVATALLEESAKAVGRKGKTYLQKGAEDMINRALGR